jgi:hypothetical protein
MPHHSLYDTPPDEEILREMYHGGGMTLKEIGEEYDRAPSTVNGWFQKYEIDRRPNVAQLEGEEHPRWNGGWEQADSNAAFYWSHEWRQVRKEVIERDDGKCTQCGDKPDRPVVHHLIPIDEGGDKFNKSNLITVCQSCHNYIHKKSYSI